MYTEPMNNEVVRQDLRMIAAAVKDPSPLRGARILVSGANGFIASYLIYALLYLNDTRHLGLHIYGLTRNEQKMRSRFGALLERPDFSVVQQDVTQPLAAELPADIIIHAASQTAPGQFQSDPVGTALGNILGTQNLLAHAAQKKSKAFLLLSTREIYGKAIADFVREDDYGGLDCTQVRACYPEAKRMSETLCAAYREQYGVPAKIARIAHCYGPGMQLSDGRVVSDFIGSIAAGRDIVMNSDGSGTLALTYIADVVAGLLGLLCDYPDFVYNISNDEEPLTVKELAQLLGALRPDLRCQVVTQMAPEATRSGYLQHKVGFLQADKVRAAGWQVRVPLREGLMRTLQFFRNEA